MLLFLDAARHHFLRVLMSGASACLGGLSATAQDANPAPPDVTGSSLSPSLPAGPVESAPKQAAARPFRLGFWSLNEVVDQEKPLAAFDSAGFVVNSGLLIGGLDSDWVAGLSLSTLKMQWFLEGRSDLTAPPGSFGSSVVLGYRDGRVVKIDALTGKKQWTTELDSFSERPFLLNGTTLYVVTAAQVLYALDFQTGRKLWLYDGGFPDGLSIGGGARPVVHENKVIFGLASGELLAVGVDDGKLVWRYNPSYTEARFHDYVGEMVVRNGKLLVTRYDGLAASIDLQGSNRSVAWQEQLPGLTTSSFRNGRYFVGALNGDIYALNPDDGRRIWRTVTGASVTTITAGETTLYVAGHDGRVTALASADGKVAWYDKLGTSLASPPAVFNDAIYYTTGLKSVYAYKLR